MPQQLQLTYQFLADRPETIPLVARWYFEEWGYAQPGNSIEATIERIKGKLNRNKLPLHILAMQGEEVLGVAQLKIREMPEYPDKEFWLGSVFVAPHARGRGVAFGLCVNAAELAKSFGTQELYLATESLDGGVYAKADWVPSERTESRGDQVLVMVKHLGV